MSSNADQRRSDTATRVIPASRDTIYQAFADAAALVQWLPPSGMSGHVFEYDFKEGGRYRIELRYDEKMSPRSGKTTDRTDITSGRFLELLAGRRIKQSVTFESPDPAFADEMTMTWSFDAATDGTTVTITADKVSHGISKSDHDAGLRSSLEKLAAFVEHH